MKKILLLALAAFSFASSSYAQDIRLNVTTPIAIATKNRAWGNFNQVYLFRPTIPQISLYIFVRNNNPTNAHTFTLNIYQTMDASATDWTNNQKSWVTDTIQGTCSPVSASSTSSCYVVTMFAAQIAIRLTTAAAAAGSPDTGDIYIIQGVGEPKGQTVGSGSTAVQGVIADGAAAAGIFPVLVAGFDGTNVQTLRTDTNGTVGVGVDFTPGDSETNVAARVFTDAGGRTLSVFPFVFNGTNWERHFNCNNSAIISTAVSGSTELVAAGFQVIRICFASFSAGGAVNVKFVYGTGVNCATGSTNMTGAFQMAANSNISLPFSADGSLRTVGGNALCINLSAAIQVNGVITYARY